MTKRKSAKIYHEFDSTEFLLLAFVAVILLAYVTWRAGLVPSFFPNPLVLGTSVAR